MDNSNIPSFNKIKSVESYYLNPIICKFCKKVVDLRGRKVSDVRKTIFCDIVCSGKYTALYLRKCELRERQSCVDCNKKIWYKSTRCKSCQGKNIAKKHLFTTKKELKENVKYWVQYRTKICKHARIVYRQSNKPKQCHICQYNNHYEVCHIKDVASFPDTATLMEINHIDNLVALCPNHHWEFDNKLFEI